MTSRLAAALSGGNENGTVGASGKASSEAEGSGGDVNVTLAEGELEGLNLEGFTEEEISSLNPGGEEEEGEGEEGKPGGEEKKEGGDNKEEEDDGLGKPPPKSAIPPKGFVSVTALREARAKIKELEASAAAAAAKPVESQELIELRNFRTNITSRLLDLRQQQQQPPKKEEEENKAPDPMKDPVGAAAYALKKLEQIEAEKAANEKAAKDAQDKQEQDAQRFQTVISEADKVLNVAIKDDPSIAEAFTFASAAARQELIEQGFRGDALEAKMQQMLYAYSYNAPMDPKRMKIYVQRNARYWGWEPGKKFGEQAKPPQKVDPSDQLKKLGDTVKRNKTLSGGKGGGEAELSLDDLASMSGVELEALAAANPALFDKIAGM